MVEVPRAKSGAFIVAFGPRCVVGGAVLRRGRNVAGFVAVDGDSVDADAERDGHTPVAGEREGPGLAAEGIGPEQGAD